jgi:hypothetical protein
VASAFRLLDAPPVKMALKAATGPLLLGISSDIYAGLAPGDPGPGPTISSRLVTAQVAAHQYQGWIRIPAQVAWQHVIAAYIGLPAAAAVNIRLGSARPRHS